MQKQMTFSRYINALAGPPSDIKRLELETPVSDYQGRDGSVGNIKSSFSSITRQQLTVPVIHPLRSGVFAVLCAFPLPLHCSNSSRELSGSRAADKAPNSPWLFLPFCLVRQCDQFSPRRMGQSSFGRNHHRIYSVACPDRVLLGGDESGVPIWTP